MLFNCCLLSLKECLLASLHVDRGRLSRQTRPVCSDPAAQIPSVHKYITEGPWGQGMPPFLKCPSFWGLCTSLSLCHPLSVSPPFSSRLQVRLAWGLRDQQSSEGRASRGGVWGGHGSLAPPTPTPGSQLLLILQVWCPDSLSGSVYSSGTYSSLLTLISGVMSLLGRLFR